MSMGKVSISNALKTKIPLKDLWCRVGDVLEIVSPIDGRNRRYVIDAVEIYDGDVFVFGTYVCTSGKRAKSGARRLGPSDRWVWVGTFDSH